VVNPDWVAKLVEDFAKRLDNCTNEDALEAVVKRTWIQNMDSIEPTVNDKKIKEVEEIEFTREGKIAIAPDNLVMLGGNHRRLALKIYVDALKEQLEKDNKQVKTKTTQAHKQSDITGPIGAELKELKERVEWLEGKIAISRHWVVALYDIGTQ
jgi:hypothetical protein